MKFWLLYEDVSSLHIEATTDKLADRLFDTVDDSILRFNFYFVNLPHSL